MVDITPIVEAVAALLAVLITTVVIPYFKVKTTIQQQKEVASWVRIAVNAAEQIYKGAGRGEEKKKYVIEWLKKHGLTVDENQLEAMIEAAVFEINNSFMTIKGDMDDSEDGDDDDDTSGC